MKFETVIAWLSNPSVLTPLGLVLGAWVKKTPWINTKLAPIINVLVATLVSAGVTIAAPQHAFHWPGSTLGVEVVTAGFGGALLRIFWDGFLQGALTTGIHSALKNTSEAVIGGKVKW